jgi:hypothetical protein
MRVAAALLIVAGAAASLVVLAEDLQPGRYTGSFTKQGNRNIEQWGIALQIDSVDQGVVKGMASRYRGNCKGDVPIQGKLDGNTLEIRETEKGGRAGDCGFRATLTVEGKRLVGKMGSGEPAELSR